MHEVSILVCVTGQQTCHRLIREGDRLARELDAQLCVLHVARPGGGLLGDKTEAEALEYLFEISREHGAEMTVVRSEDVIGAIADHARAVKALMLVLGAPRKGAEDMVSRIRAAIPELEFHVVVTE